MEPPSSLDPEAIRDEKVKALQAIKPLVLGGENSEVVRGVYTQGLVHGEKAEGYLAEKGIPENSFTETYAALQPSYRKLAMEGSSVLSAIRKAFGHESE